MELSLLDISVRLGAATILSALIGMERQFRQKPAGSRTNGLVGLGSAAMTLTGLMVAQGIPDADVTRIASVVVQGIGFLGAGVIIQAAGSVRGLTTAATMWVVAGIGIACGFGFWQVALLVTILVLALLLIFGPLDTAIEEEGEKRFSVFGKKKK